MGYLRKMYNQSVNRYDELPYLKYFTPDNCPGLKYEPYSFISEGNKLNGFFYHYDKYKEDIIVIFCHGIGGGHLSYMKEIDKIAQRGYYVLAYDNTGCCSSEGTGIKALSHSLTDLDYAIRSLKEKDEYKDKKIYVVGHSWGGFAASNIYNYHDVDKIVAISPFISAKQIFRGLVPNPLFYFIADILMKYERAANKGYADSSAINALNKVNAVGLVIHSTNDPTVKYKLNTRLLQKKCTNKNIEFVIYDNKYHHPQYTEEAVLYFNKTFDGFDKLLKQKKLQTLEEKKEYFKDVNWDKLIEPDDSFWKKVYEFLDK